jgi:hypothetical protein
MSPDLFNCGIVTLLPFNDLKLDFVSGSDIGNFVIVFAISRLLRAYDIVFGSPASARHVNRQGALHRYKSELTCFVLLSE